MTNLEKKKKNILNEAVYALFWDTVFFVSQWFIFVPKKNPEVRAHSFLIHPIQPRIKPNDKHLEQMMKITVH